MPGFLDAVYFLATSTGTVDFVPASAVQGYRTPAAASAVNGKLYGYRAESASLNEWEVGVGTYSTTGTTLARTTVLANHLGTTAKVNFTAAPNVGIVELSQDLPSLLESNTFTKPQTVSDTTDATSSSAGGALTISGGLAVAKKLFVGLAAAIGGAFKVTDTTEATGAGTTASGLFAGGLEVAKKLFVGGVLKVTDTTASTTTTTGSIQTAGGLGVAGSIYGATVNAGTGASRFGATGTNYGVFNVGQSTSSYIASFANNHAVAGDAGLLIGVGAVSDTTSPLVAFDDGAISIYCGGIYRNNAGVTYATSSDTRGKPFRELLDLNRARGIVDAIRIWDFDKDGNAIRGVGVIAQEAYEVHKSLATPGATPDAWWVAEKAAAVPFITANVQQINSRLDVLEAQLNRIEGILKNGH